MRAGDVVRQRDHPVAYEVVTVYRDGTVLAAPFVRGKARLAKARVLDGESLVSRRRVHATVES